MRLSPWIGVGLVFSTQDSPFFQLLRSAAALDREIIHVRPATAS